MIFFFVSLSTYFCYLILKYRRTMMTIQIDKLGVKDFGKWIIKNFKKIFLTPEILIVILIIINMITNSKVMGICMVVFYMLIFLYEFRIKNAKFKLRAIDIRLVITICIIYLLVFGGFYLSYLFLQQGILYVNDTWLYYLIVILMGYFSYFITLLAMVINKSMEYLIKKKSKL